MRERGGRGEGGQQEEKSIEKMKGQCKRKDMHMYIHVHMYIHIFS